MKNFFSALNLPFLLLLSSSMYFVYLIQVGTAISFPLAIMFAFVVALYAYQVYMDHIKKADPHSELERKWSEYDAEVESKLEMFRERYNNELGKLESKITNADLSAKFTKPIPQKIRF